MNKNWNYLAWTGQSLAFGSLLAVLIAGCSGSSGSSVAVVTPSSGSSIATLAVVDANKKTIGTGAVSITDTAGAAVSSGVTSGVGALSVSLPPGSYGISVTKGGVISKAKIVITNINAFTNATVIIPAVQDATGSSMVDISSTAVVAAIGGKISDASGPISGATVSLSSSTAATVASAVTDATGYYLLLINVNKSLANVDGNFVGNLRVSKTGYNAAVTTGLQVSPGTIEVGKNYTLTQASALSALYSEDFESSSGTACGAWTIVNSTTTTGWHRHVSVLNISNAAFTKGLVSLAPDDLSLGKVPDPIGGTTACWYGSAVMGIKSDEQGNFIGVSGTNTVNSLNGGSGSANHGALISPTINLTTVPAGTAISLSFNTFWEIESVNPNNNGYDIMEIDYSIDNGTTWIALARLNPLSDPITTGINRSPIPFSNTGYNAAPKWVAQEPIPLVNPTTSASLAGNNVKLRFAFNTVDGLYNGFRGWMIDNVAISQVAGTYPVLPGGKATTFNASAIANNVRSPIK